MDWRHPNVGCLFSTEQVRPPHTDGSTRNIRSVTESGREWDRESEGWPPGTEYQNAYRSHYTPVEPLSWHVGSGAGDYLGHLSGKSFAESSGEKKSSGTLLEQNLQKLYTVTPLPIIDKHYRGARYNVDSPIGIIVPDELSRVRETLSGHSIILSSQSDLDNVYTPNYRYMEWVARPAIELHREMDSNRFFCRLPETPSQFWDFYNVVRMRRPAKISNAESSFLPTNTMPIPSSRSLPDVPPVSSHVHLGKFNNILAS